MTLFSFQDFIFHALESTIWCGLLFLLLWSVRITDSVLRCWVYRLCLLKFFLPTIFLSGLFQVKPATEMLPALIVVAEPLDSLATATAESDFGMLSYVWISVFSGLLLFGLLTILRSCQRVFGEMKPLDGREKEIYEFVLGRTSQAKALGAGYVESGPSIALYGIFRPRIIAKRSFLESLSDEELASAFQHEIAHWMRKDHYWRLFAETVVCFLWFNPLVWFIRKQLLYETEKSCDEQVLAHGQEIASYASCLLKAAEFSNKESQFGAIALSETSLKRRVSNIIQYQKGKLSIMKLVAIILSSAGLLFGSFVLFANEDVQDVLPQEKIYEISDVDVKPRPTKQVPPIYPIELKQEGVDGSVVLVFVIKKDGSVEQIQVEKSTHMAFERPSIDSVVQWKFTPGLVDGEEVDVRVRAPLVFKVNSSEKNLLQELEESKDPIDQQFYKTLLPQIKKLESVHASGNVEDIQVLWKELMNEIEAYNESKKS